MIDRSSRVADLMTKEVVTLYRNDEIALADDLMNLGRVRHIPVVDEDETLVGIITQRDLFRSALLQSLGYGKNVRDPTLAGIRIKELMTTNVITTHSSTPLRDAAELMLHQKVGCLPVLDEGKLAGILTEADFVRAFVGGTSAA